MRNFSIFLLLILLNLKCFAQLNCGVADSYLVYAYSNIKDAYESNNKDHLKYYSNKSLESFEKAKPKLKSCGCESAYNLVFDSMDLLKKVETAETFEDGRFFVKRVKENAQKSIIELDKCNAGNIDTSIDTINDLASIENQQLQLEAQQKILQEKALEIQRKLEAQTLKASKLKKEQLINHYKSAINLNVTNYNETLKIFNWQKDLITFNDTESEIIANKSIDDIKTHYLTILKTLTNSYLNKLNSCRID